MFLLLVVGKTFHFIFLQIYSSVCVHSILKKALVVVIFGLNVFAQVIYNTTPFYILIHLFLQKNICKYYLLFVVVLVKTIYWNICNITLLSSRYLMKHTKQILYFFIASTLSNTQINFILTDNANLYF